MKLSVYARVTARFSLRLSAIVLFGAFSLPAWASGGLFSSVTPITEPTPVDSDTLGYADNSGVALSADGQTALVAAASATVGTKSHSGKAYLWHYASGTWTLMQEIDDPDNAASDYFGYSIALSADGKSALIGSYATVGGVAAAGKAYLYTVSGTTWSLSHEFDGPVLPSGFGATSVALSGNGSVAVIGAEGFATNAGAAYIFSLANGTWSTPAVISDPDATAFDYFSYPVAISADGSSVLIGSLAAVGGQSHAGKAYLYTVSGSTWSKAHEFDDPNGVADDFFGDSGVSLSNDGQTALVGANGVTVGGKFGAGSAYVYSESNGTWSLPVTLTDPDQTILDNFGFPVAISGDGSAVLIGSEAAVQGQGAAGKAYLYILSGDTWLKAKEFDDPAATAFDYFGHSGVALSYDGEAAFISAYNTTVSNLSAAGEAYLYLSPDDVSVSMSASPATVVAGQQTPLDITVTNTDSAVTANLLTLTDTLPAGLSYVNSSAAGGTCSVSGATVTCTLASLAPGKTWQPTITAGTASSSSAATYSDTASVTGNEPDPNSANNSASASVSVSASTTPSSSSGGGGGSGLGWLEALALVGLYWFSRRRYPQASVSTGVKR